MFSLQSERRRAADALAAFRLFPSFASRFLEEGDDIDSVLRDEARAANECSDDEEELETDDELEDDLTENYGVDSPESEWKLAKIEHSAVSPSMDKLMTLLGLSRSRYAGNEHLTNKRVLNSLWCVGSSDECV